MTFICEISQLAYVYFMKRKSETPAKLEEFLDQTRMDGYAPVRKLWMKSTD